MSQTKENVFHASRSPFIIFPNVGVLFAEHGQSLSHTDMLKNMGFDASYILHILINFPRGFYSNNNLVLYQGEAMTVGTLWLLSKENFPLVVRYLPYLKQFFNLKKTTSVYLGVKVGNIGEVWELVNKTSIKNIKKTQMSFEKHK